MSRHWDIVLNEFPHTSYHGIHITLKLSSKGLQWRKTPSGPLYFFSLLLDPYDCPITVFHLQILQVCASHLRRVYDLVLCLSFIHLNPNEKKIRGTNSWRNSLLLTFRLTSWHSFGLPHFSVSLNMEASVYYQYWIGHLANFIITEIASNNPNQIFCVLEHYQHHQGFWQARGAFCSIPPLNSADSHS